MAGSAEGGGTGEEPLVEINVTPMVDVLLSLLIIFMVASPKPPNENMPLAVPTNDKPIVNSDPNATLVVKIDKDGNVELSGKTLPKDWSAMVEAFENSPKAIEDDKIAIKADDKTKYGVVIQVMAAAREAGIGKVGIASERL